MKRGLKYIVSSLIVMALVVLLAYRIQNVLAKQQDLPQSSPVQSVQVKEVGSFKKENSIDNFGSIESVRRVSVSSKLAGRIGIVPVENGQWVEAGTTLAILEDQDYQTQVKASLETLQKAQLRVDDLQKDYEHYKKLFTAGAMSANDLGKAKLALEVAQIDLNSARIGVDNAQLSLKETVVSAPIAGVVAYRSVNIGQMVSPGVPLMALEDVSSVYAKVDVKQMDLNQIKEGLTVKVMPTDDEKQVLTGEVFLISPVANQAARVFEVRVKIDNQNRILKPGMFVKTRITTGSSEDVIAIPINALSGKEGAYGVYLAEENQARKRAVQIGAILGEQIEIKAGLRSGEKVIVTNINKLKDQDQITVVEN